MRVTGAIRHDGNFYASDGAERWFIEVRKTRADGLPFDDGRRVGVDLEVAGTVYSGGIRTTPTIVYITYDLYDKNNEKIRLADAMAGFARNEKVVLDVNGTHIRVFKENEALSEKWLDARSKAVRRIRRELANAESEEQSQLPFSPKSIEDARSKTMRSIVNRRGQAKFRTKLLSAYEGRCAITGCDFTQALEAAHIYPYRGDQTNHIANGMLMRADIHTLFDLGLFAVDSESHKVILSSELQNSSYSELDGKILMLPKKEKDWPSKDALLAHREWAAL